jgi:hypothetical protein
MVRGACVLIWGRLAQQNLCLQAGLRLRRLQILIGFGRDQALAYGGEEESEDSSFEVIDPEPVLSFSEVPASKPAAAVVTVVPAIETTFAAKKNYYVIVNVGANTGSRIGIFNRYCSYGAEVHSRAAGTPVFGGRKVIFAPGSVSCGFRTLKESQAWFHDQTGLDPVHYQFFA